MFESFKKKLLGFFGKEEEKPKEKKSVKKKAKKLKVAKKAKEVFKKITEKIEGAFEEEEIEVPKPSEEIEELEEAEEIVEEVKKEIEKEKTQVKESFFSKLMKKLSVNIKLSQEEFGAFFAELEIILLENNVAVEVAEKIKQDLAAQLIGAEIKKIDMQKFIFNSLKDSILNILIEPPNLLEQIKSESEPYIILFFGINGSGKTTSIAKIANLLKKHNITSVMAAADTFRAASIEQLKTHGQKLNIEVIAHDYGADPAAVAFDAIQHAKKNHIKVVLIDTAGRMYTKSNLMKEMEKIVRVSKPDLKIFVGESITGNDATSQAKTFNETAGIDGIILTKADVDDKAGTILSVSYVTKKPIYFLGTGQSYHDLTDFKKQDVLKHIGLE